MHLAVSRNTRPRCRLRTKRHISLTGLWPPQVERSCMLEVKAEAMIEPAVTAAACSRRTRSSPLTAGGAWNSSTCIVIEPDLLRALLRSAYGRQAPSPSHLHACTYCHLPNPSHARRSRTLCPRRGSGSSSARGKRVVLTLFLLLPKS